MKVISEDGQILSQVDEPIKLKAEGSKTQVKGLSRKYWTVEKHLLVAGSYRFKKGDILVINASKEYIYHHRKDGEDALIKNHISGFLKKWKRDDTALKSHPLTEDKALTIFDPSIYND